MLLCLCLVAGCNSDTRPDSNDDFPPMSNARNQWLTSYDQAVEKSRETGKPIFAFFTGSDWCQYCTLLDNAVLNTETFASWARKNVVLLELDFPRNHPQPPELQKQNESLLNRYRVTGFPTVLLLTADGKPLLQAGYQPVTAEQWIEVFDAKMKAALKNQAEKPAPTQE